jgi:probable rRNA maturation factor
LGLAEPEVSLVLTDDEHIHQLNRKWRDEDTATDVLSFPLHEPSRPGDLPEDTYALGDIVISIEYAESLIDTAEHHRRVASELGVTIEELDWALEDEIQFLFIHGLLHLVGYDHPTPADEREMKRQERRLWQASQSD